MNFLRIFDSALPRKLAVVLAAVFTLAANQYSQTRRAPREVTSLTDVVNAVQFSPNGRVLAIARGARDYNRVDLWDTQSGNLLRSIKGFDGAVWSVSFSPDGKTLVTGSGGIHQVKITAKRSELNGRPFTELKWWDTVTGELKQRLELPDEDLVSIAAIHSPDGQRLAMVANRLSSAMVPRYGPGAIRPSSDPLFRPVMLPAILFDSDLKILDARTGALISKLKEGFGSQFPRSDSVSTLSQKPRPMVFSPDGRLVAAWNESEVRLWSSSTGAEVLKTKKSKGRLSAIAFSPDGHLLAAAVVNVSHKTDQWEVKSELHTWDVSTGAPQQVLPLATPVVSSLTFANNGQQLFVSGLQNAENHPHASMELADLQTGSLGKLVATDEGTTSSVYLSPDGGTMAFQTDASTIKLLETRTWRTRYTLGSEDQATSGGALRRFMVTVKSVTAVAFVPDGKTVVGEIEDTGIKQWDTRTGEAKKTLAEEGEAGSVAEISTNGAAVAEVTSEETVRLRNLASGEQRPVPLGNRKALALGLSGNGEILAIDCADEIVLLNAGNLTTRQSLKVRDKITHLALSSDGGLLAASTSDGAVKVWNVNDGTIRQVRTAGGEVSALQFGPQDQMLAFARTDGTLSVWNPQNNALSFEVKKHQGAVNAIAFSKDGSLMATGGDDRTAIIWEVASGKARRTLKGHDLAIASLAFSPDAAILAVGSGNASVVLWQVASGKLDRVLK